MRDGNLFSIIRKVLIGNKGTQISPQESLDQLHDRIKAVSDLPIGEAEQRLGVRGYTDPKRYRGRPAR